LGDLRQTQCIYSILVAIIPRAASASKCYLWQVSFWALCARLR